MNDIAKRISRIGEEGYNTLGTKMKIIRYYLSDDITVEFQDEHKVKVDTTYCNFNRGSIKNPYDKSLFEVGYFGVGKYVARKDYKPDPAYLSWRHLLERCYDESQKHKHPAYYGIATVCDDWLCYQNYADWYYKNYYDIGDGKRMHIDKDILVKGNKVYSPETCIFVPQRINMLFVIRKSKRGDLPCGVSENPSGNYNAVCGIDDGIVENLGTFKTIEDAFNAYKTRKEQNIKEVADKYRHLIPPKLYKALYSWKVEITD